MSYYHPHFIPGLIKTFESLSQERSQATHEEYRSIARSVLNYFNDGFPSDPRLIAFLILLTTRGIAKYDRRRLAELIAECLKKEQKTTTVEFF